MVTQAVADVSTQTQEQGRTPGRGGVRWRYGMGFVVLLASILSLVLVGQIAGWIQDPHGPAQAAAAADYQAQVLQQSLRALPAPAAGAVAEAEYARLVRAADGVLLDVTYPAAGAPTGLTVQLEGRATSSVLSGRHLTVVSRCYHYDWVSAPVAAVHTPTACPTASSVEPAVRTVTGPPTDPAAGPTALRGLAMRLAALPAAAREVSVDGSGLQALLSAAGLPSGTPWAAAYPQRAGAPRDGVLAIGGGGSSGCLFVDLHAGALTVWTAPQLAPCTGVRAARAVLAG